MQEVNSGIMQKNFCTSQINKKMGVVKSEVSDDKTPSVEAFGTEMEKPAIKVVNIFKDIFDKWQTDGLGDEELKDTLEQVSMNELYPLLSDEDKQFIEKYKLVLQNDGTNLHEVMSTFKNDLILKNNISNSGGVAWLSNVSLVSINLVYIKIYSDLMLNAAEVVKKQLNALRDAIALLQALVDFITIIKSMLNEKYVADKASNPSNYNIPEPKWNSLVETNEGFKYKNHLILSGDDAPKLLQKYFYAFSVNQNQRYAINDDGVKLMVQAILDITQSAIQGNINLDAHVQGVFGNQAEVQNVASNVNNFIQQAKDKMTSLGSKVPDMANTLRDLDSLFVNSTLSSVRVR